MGTNKSAIALLRVSTDKQDVARQRSDIERVKRTYQLDIARTLELVGVSGTATLDHAGVQRVLADLGQPDVGGIAISSLDRLFRPGKRYGQFAILDRFVDAGKVIWSAREGLVDPTTDEGYDKCISAGGRAGAEWRELRRRTREGKEVYRLKGLHPDGKNKLPRGVLYTVPRDADGRKIGDGKWSYDPVELLRARKGYSLLFAGWSYRAIAKELGGWTARGIHTWLGNPLWHGIRRYEPRGERKEPLEIRVIPEVDAAIDAVMWQKAQAILTTRSKEWGLSRRPPRFLLTGLLRCAVCGKPLYGRSGRKGITRFEYYQCSSGKNGARFKCGVKASSHDALDRAVEKVVADYLLDTKVLLRLLETAQQDTKPQTDTASAEKEVAKLEVKRTRIVDLAVDGVITREDCSTRLKTLDAQIRELRTTIPVPAPVVDIKRLTQALTRAFAGFARRPFPEKQAFLRKAFKNFVIGNRTIESLTLNGAYIGELQSLAKVSPRPSLP
jgi:DNA invertase Pin-like site-specific DNA recombinase